MNKPRINNHKPLAVHAPPNISSALDLYKRIGAVAQKVEDRGKVARDSMLALYQNRLTYTFIMDNEVGVFRDQDALESALKAIRFLKKRYQRISLERSEARFNYSLIRALELENMIDLAEVITMTALMRRESRGAHWRTDYPQRDDDNFLKHSLVTMVEDYLKTEYIDVNLGMFEVKERKY